MASLSLTAEEFSKLGTAVLKQCSGYIGKLSKDPIVPSAKQIKLIQDYEYENLPETGEGDKILNTLESLFSQCCQINGRFMGFVVGSALPIAALADLVISVLNQNTVAPFVAPSAVAIEHQVIRWIGQAIGCEGYSGSLTSGGSASNIMGLAMARESKMASNYTGIRSEHMKMVFYASKEIHMSIPKAMSLLGLGRQMLRLLDVDNNFRLHASTVARAIAVDRRNGLIPAAIIASAGTTRTGAIDCLDDLADLAQNEGLWLHVDGAYGAFAALATPEKFAGLNRADSITLDPHKWLFMPLDVGCILVRDRRHAVQAFSYSDEYVHSPYKPMEISEMSTFQAFYEESLELSRRFRALKIWMSLRFHGAALFRQAIASNMLQAQLLATKIDNHEDLELMVPPQLSVVCFRVRKIEAVDIPVKLLNDVNTKILARLIARGRVYLSRVVIGEDVSMRACITNHLTVAMDVKIVINEVLAASLDSGMCPGFDLTKT